MNYPTMDRVNDAAVEQLAVWYRRLPPPGYNWQYEEHAFFKKKAREEIKILSRITERLKEVGNANKLFIGDRSDFELDEPELLEELPEG